MQCSFPCSHLVLQSCSKVSIIFCIFDCTKVKYFFKYYIINFIGTTLQDLTEAALEEIERQEAAMENLDGTETITAGSVIHEISAGNLFFIYYCVCF